MYTPKYPAVAQGGLAHRELYIYSVQRIYSEYPAVRPAWMAVEEGWTMVGGPEENCGEV